MDHEATAEFIAGVLAGSLWDNPTYGARGYIGPDNTTFMVKHYETGLRFKVTVNAIVEEE